MLLEQRLPDWANRHTVMAVGGQTGRPVDDVAAVVSDGSRIGWMCVQAKKGLTLSQSDSSPLASAIDQAVALYLSGVPDNPPDVSTLRDLDSRVDRIVILTDENATSPIRVALAHVTERLRTLPDAVPLEDAATNDQQRRAFQVLCEHVRRNWRDRNGVDPDARTLRSILRLLAVHALDLRPGGPDERAIMVLLKQVVADADKATGLWHELGEIGRSLAEQRAWLNREELVARLRSAGHDLATGVRASTTATELLARQLSAWQEKLGLAEHDAWQKLTYGLNQEIPAIRSDRLDALEALAAWLLGQSWPTTFPRVRTAFVRHAYALRALLSALRNYTEAHGSARRLERLYQRLERWDPPEYQRLLRETQLRQQVIWYLVTELSRSVNLIIQAVREEVDPGFRIVEGFVLSMEPGIMNMYLVREQYENWDWDDPPPFPSLGQIRSAIEAKAAESGDQIPDIDVRALAPTGRL